MLPVLRVLGDEQVHTRRDLLPKIVEHFQLSDAERKEMLPSGKATVIQSRIGWAFTYMKQARAPGIFKAR
jgi:restriction system protein